MQLPKFEICQKTADDITISNLTQTLAELKRDNKKLKKLVKYEGTSTSWRDNDLKYNKKLIAAIKTVLAYHGEYGYVVE